MKTSIKVNKKYMQKGFFDLEISLKNDSETVTGQGIDYAWKYTDKKGHKHIWRGKTITNSRPICGWYINEEGRRSYFKYYRCSKCGEKLSPELKSMSFYITYEQYVTGSFLSLNVLDISKEYDFSMIHKKISGKFVIDKIQTVGHGALAAKHYFSAKKIIVNK